MVSDSDASDRDDGDFAATVTSKDPKETTQSGQMDEQERKFAQYGYVQQKEEEVQQYGYGNNGKRGQVEVQRGHRKPLNPKAPVARQYGDKQHDAEQYGYGKQMQKQQGKPVTQKAYGKKQQPQMSKKVKEDPEEEEDEEVRRWGILEACVRLD